MALITGLCLIAVSILTAALSRLLAEEMSAWTPSIIRSLIKFAVGRLPEHHRERFEEEWQSHVNDVPGQIGKLLAALCFLFAAYHITLNDRRAREREVSFFAQLDDADSVATTLVNLILNNEELASMEGIDSLRREARSALSGLKESFDEVAALRSELPDARLPLIVKVLHPVMAYRFAASKGRLLLNAKQTKEMTAKIVTLLEKLKRLQSNQ